MERNITLFQNDVADILILCFGIEARASGLPKILVAIDLRIKEDALEGRKDGTKCHLLLVGTGVCSFAFLVESSDVTDTDTLEVVKYAVCTCLSNVSTYFHFTVRKNDVMVTDVLPSSVGDVPLTDFICIDIHAYRCGRVMNDEFVNRSVYAFNSLCHSLLL